MTVRVGARSDHARRRAAWHDRPRDARRSASSSHVYPLGSRVNERGHLEIGGCDAVELAQEFGTPAYVVAEDDLRARARAFIEALAARHSRLRRAVRLQGVPLHRRLPGARRGGTGVRRRLRRRAGAGAPRRLRPGTHLLARQRQIGGRSCARRWRPESATSCSTRFDEFERLERVAAELGHRQEVLIRVTPDVAGDTHHAISTGQADSKFGFSVDDARGGDRSACGRPRTSSLVGLHFHIGSQLFELEPFREAVRAIATLGDFPVYNLGGGLGVAYTAAQQSAGDRRCTSTRSSTPCTRELGADKRLLLEPGRALVANSTVTLYTVQTVKRNVSTWVAVDGGMSDNLRPMLYGSRLRGDRSPTARWRRSTRALPPRRQALRVRRCDRPRRAAARSGARRRARHRRPPAPTATRWRTTTTACRGRR